MHLFKFQRNQQEHMYNFSFQVEKKNMQKTVTHADKLIVWLLWRKMQKSILKRITKIMEKNIDKL